MSTREYEAMFLLDNAAASSDFDGTTGQVDRLLEKHGAEILRREQWDERKLSYEIKGHRRATYYLVYMRVDTDALEEIDSDVALTDVILRHMTIRLEEPWEQHIDRQEKERERMAEESRRSALSGWGDRKRGDRGPRERNRGEGRKTGPVTPAPTEGEAAPAEAPAAAPAAAPAEAPAEAPAAAPAVEATPSAGETEATTEVKSETAAD